MVRYRNAAGRVVTRSQPDRGLEASKRWSRVEPLSPIPMPERAQDSDGQAPEHDAENDGQAPSEEE